MTVNCIIPLRVVAQAATFFSSSTRAYIRQGFYLHVDRIVLDMRVIKTPNEKNYWMSFVYNHVNKVCDQKNLLRKKRWYI